MIAVAVLLACWFLVTLLQGDDPLTKVKDPTRCPDCGRELPAQFQATGECPYCSLSNSRPGTAGSGRPGRFLLPAVLIGIFLALLGTHITIYLRKHWRQTDEEDSFSYFHCPLCQRKLRYRSRQSGRTGLCPGCRKPVLFPTSA
jgi:hypothetical protein